MMKYGEFGLFYDGEFHSSVNSRAIDVICPANGEIIARTSFAEYPDVNPVVEAAVKGQKYWQKLSGEKRKEWMFKLREALLDKADFLIEVLMWETGKNKPAAIEDFDKLEKGLKFFPEAVKGYTDEYINDIDGDCEHRIVYRPIGVVAALLAWNFPLLNMGYKIGPALASGCSIIVKPSQQTPLSALLVAEISRGINFPPGVLNVVPGDNKGFGNGLAGHKHVAGITMIGSKKAAAEVLRASTTSIKRFSLELGGNAPFIVFEDADLEAAADFLVGMKTANTGQICVSPNRVFINRQVKPEFLEMVIDRLKAVTIGFPLEDPDAVMGPMISMGEAARVRKLVLAAVHAGGEIIFGEASDKNTAFVTPVVIEITEIDNPIHDEEIFGPVIAVYSFETDDEVLTMANATSAGLAAYVFTADRTRALRFAEALEFGEVMVNRAKWDIYLPHIGIKDSGVGIDCSKYALEDYFYRKRITSLIR